LAFPTTLCVRDIKIEKKERERKRRRNGRNIKLDLGRT
jgi:hypothetical protein